MFYKKERKIKKKSNENKINACFRNLNHKKSKE
jgi:hypothetical protein